MENKSDKKNKEDWLKEIPLQSVSKSYQEDEMIACKKCKRINPPSRLDCMYCGEELEFDQEQSNLLKPVLRKLEPYQKGYNLIYKGNLETWNDNQISEVAKMTRLEANDLRRLAERMKSLPIARAETRNETEIVSQRLKEIGIETIIIEDERFEMEKISKRLRRLELKDNKIQLMLFNNDEIIEIDREDLNLVVVGVLFERQLESTETRKKKGETKVLENAETSSDEILIDIYSKRDLISYRILPRGFDFSFLGKEKKLLAIENIKILIEKLREFATSAVFDDDYLKVRDNLTEIWEVEELNETKGMKRKSFGSYNRINVTSTSNLNQFTKYSRLQWLLQSGE